MGKGPGGVVIIYLNIKTVSIRRHEETVAFDDCGSQVTLLDQECGSGGNEREGEGGEEEGDGWKDSDGCGSHNVHPSSTRPHLPVHFQRHSFAQTFPVYLAPVLSPPGPGTLRWLHRLCWAGPRLSPSVDCHSPKCSL